MDSVHYCWTQPNMGDEAKLKERQKLIQSRIEKLKRQKNKIKETPDEGVFNDKCFSDFKIKTGEEVFFVSKGILALKSPVFKAMFQSGMKEVQDGTLVLTEDSEVVRAMLLFMYHNKNVRDVKLAMRVLQLAHRYEIELLRAQCELFLMENIQVDDAEECQLLARSLDLRFLALKCSEVFFFNFLTN
ncbi:unnamed protein product [Bursaphelenchus okinawaensis]|uniref:BTB domain-containing protein n=1 Tax=Bursaphelenchus okinawaensis TaxID=465554 RepID=A0A811KDA7_9BILA|nr:unnamed protein product [Bursaphelenchus okinawaensis]CAG9102507.1 unnamed protein product [Bursaphelenchus okinawaensis]